MEYLTPTNNIIVLDWYFNLTNKSNHIGKLKYDLIRFFDPLVLAYFLGHLVYIIIQAGVADGCCDYEAAHQQVQLIQRPVQRLVLVYCRTLSSVSVGDQPPCNNAKTMSLYSDVPLTLFSWSRPNMYHSRRPQVQWVINPRTVITHIPSSGGFRGGRGRAGSPPLWRRTDAVTHGHVR